MKVTIVGFNDWEALYVDGKLKDEGYSLILGDVLHALDIEHEIVRGPEEWFHTHRRLPKELSDLKAGGK
jgi:hypothetical protein